MNAFDSDLKEALIQVTVGIDTLARQRSERDGRIEDLERALDRAWEENEELRRRCEAAERDAAALREKLGAA